ncbi:hypothetical protein C4K18_3088 [Pseudomonas chlororaphis subsp. aurantiaca]|nr:hypothetical protein C4K18_3088 [Pseudomonas chlororaphis subsp. aurantiaca]
MDTIALFSAFNIQKNTYPKQKLMREALPSMADNTLVGFYILIVRALV